MRCVPPAKGYMNKKKNKKPKQYAKAKIQTAAPMGLPPSEVEGSQNHEAVVPIKPQGKSSQAERPEMEKIRVTDKWIAAATVVIAIATVVQGYEVVTGSGDTHNLALAALAANRAWLAPVSIHLGSPLENGLPVKYQIRIANTGREPALGVTWHVVPRKIVYIPSNSGNGESDIDMGRNITCDGTQPKPTDGYVIYPQIESTTSVVPLDISNTPSNRQMIDAVLNKTGSLLIEGCFAYRTGGGPHTSAFRFFLRDIPDQRSFVAGENGKPDTGWRFNYSPVGNSAN